MKNLFPKEWDAAAIAVQNKLLVAWEPGIGTCWVSTEKEEGSEILNVPKTHFVLAVIPVGYSKTKPQKHDENSRKNLKEIVYHEKYGRRVD